MSEIAEFLRSHPDFVVWMTILGVVSGLAEVAFWLVLFRVVKKATKFDKRTRKTDES